jgi:hypothetical protein
LGATSPHTLILSNVTTAIDATSNIITSGNLKISGLKKAIGKPIAL